MSSFPAFPALNIEPYIQTPAEREEAKEAYEYCRERGEAGKKQGRESQLGKEKRDGKAGPDFL